MKIFLGTLTLLSLLFLVQAANRTTTKPQEPRFCGLSANATTFQCSWYNYAMSVADRSIPILVIGPLLFLLCTVAVLMTCCCRGKNFSSKVVLSYEYTDKVRNSSSRLKALFMIVPFFILLLGAILVLVAHYKLNGAFKGGSDLLQDKYNQIQYIMQSLVAFLHTAEDFLKIDLSDYEDQLTSGLSTILTAVNTVTDYLVKVHVTRQFLAWFATTLALVVGFCGFAYVVNGKKST